MTISLVDLHCHLLPGDGDGPRDWNECLAMARLAVAEGTSTIIATPQQLGSSSPRRSDEVRCQVCELQQRLVEANLPLGVLPGANVRIEPEIVDNLARGEVLTLGDRQRHVLMELPHDRYLPLEPILEELSARNLVGILSHPERNHGILRRPAVLAPLVEAGLLVQVAAGSLCGTIHPECQLLAERLVREGLVHFVASDGHRPRCRRPQLRRAYERVVALTDQQTADDLCSRNPVLVAEGKNVRPGRRHASSPAAGEWTRRSAA